MKMFNNGRGFGLRQLHKSGKKPKLFSSWLAIRNCFTISVLQFETA